MTRVMKLFFRDLARLGTLRGGPALVGWLGTSSHRRTRCAYEADDTAAARRDTPGKPIRCAMKPCLKSKVDDTLHNPLTGEDSEAVQPNQYGAN